MNCACCVASGSGVTCILTALANAGFEGASTRHLGFDLTGPYRNALGGSAGGIALTLIAARTTVCQLGKAPTARAGRAPRPLGRSARRPLPLMMQTATGAGDAVRSSPGAADDRSPTSSSDHKIASSVNVVISDQRSLSSMSSCWMLDAEC